MTIDEAIVHAKEVAIEQSSIATELLLGGCDASKYIECKEYHEQLAEWLEELKAYRNHVFSGEMTQSMLKEEKNKAIDDFAETVKSLIVDLSVIRFKDIDEIAEQLKN